MIDHQTDLIRDYILINYNGNDKVYIPVEKINTIYKYGDADTTNIKLSSLTVIEFGTFPLFSIFFL